MRPMLAPWLAPWCVALPLALGATVATAADAPPWLLHEGSWVCATPADYDQALVEQAKTSGYQQLKALRARLLAEESCMYVEDDDIEDMMAPFVEVLERAGDMVKVTFTIEFYKKVDENAAGFKRIKFAGWTAADRLADYHPVSG